MKMYPPTARRLKKAREEGDVARSPQLSAATILVIGNYIAHTIAYGAAPSIQILYENWATTQDLSINIVLLFLAQSGMVVLQYSLFPLALLFFVALIIELLQVGCHFRLRPGRGVEWTWSRLWGIERVVDGLKSALLIFGVGVPALAGLLWILVRSLEAQQEGGEVFLAMLVVGATTLGAFFLGVLMLIDERSRRLRRLRMDPDELKREWRESEGAPETRAMRKQLHQELLLHEAMESVRRAKLVVFDDTR